MDARRARRKAKKRKQIQEEIPCIIFLATNERDSFDLAEIKENKQLRIINEYADAHGLVPIRIIRRGCMGPVVVNSMGVSVEKQLRNLYESAKILTQQDFKEELKHVLSYS